MHLVDNYFMAAAFARSLPAYCTSLNIDINQAALKTGIDVLKFKSNTASISLTRFANLMELLSHQTSDDCFGLNFGQFFKMGDSGSFGFCLMHAPDLRSIVHNFERFLPLTADYNSFGVNYDQTSVEIFWSYAPIIPSVEQYTDMMAMLTLRVLRIAAGAAWQPTQVSLVGTRPKSSSLHRQLLCKDTRFDSDVNRIIFPVSDLIWQNQKSDIRIFTIMKEQCEASLQKRSKPGPILIELKKKILKKLQVGDIQMRDIALEMSVSERSLQRRLAQKNTNFEALVEETRKELSKALIEITELPLTEVAEKVGYSSLAAFSRASKTWFGMPPSQLRRKQIVTH
jgi:AraC-like DNA-binding protein